MSEAELEEYAQTIRETGLSATAGRIATLALLHRAATPLTHADVAKHLAGKGIHQATAYRNLNDMTDAGLLRRSVLGDQVWRFEPIRRGEHEHGVHPHFLCEDCGSVSCLNGVKLAEKSLAENKQVSTVKDILLRGVCNKCAAGS